MSTPTPRASSALIANAAAPAAEKSAILSKIVAALLTVAAIAGLYFAKDRGQLIAGAALVATVTGLAVVFLKAHYGEEAAPVTGPDAKQELIDALATNRAEYHKGLATLKTGLDAAAQDRAADRDHEMVRQELGRVRTELAALRATVARA